MKPGVPCHFRGAGRCTIYDERPTEPCRVFFCAWRMQGNPFPESFRPDILGVLILASQWHDQPAYHVVSAGRDPDSALIAWIQEYSGATGTPFVFKVDGDSQCFGPPDFQQDIRGRHERGEALLT